MVAPEHELADGVLHGDLPQMGCMYHEYNVIYMYIYIYIYREREREIDNHSNNTPNLPTNIAPFCLLFGIGTRAYHELVVRHRAL